MKWTEGFVVMSSHPSIPLTNFSFLMKFVFCSNVYLGRTAAIAVVTFFLLDKSVMFFQESFSGHLSFM